MQSGKKDKLLSDVWSSLSYEEKIQVLFQRQKKLLEVFLEKKAISKEQYEKSLHDLIEKMNTNNGKQEQ